MKKCSVTRVHLTCSPRSELPSRLPPVAQVPSSSLTMTALATLLRLVSPPHGALLCSALDRWRLGDDLRCSSTLPMYLPAVRLQAGSCNRSCSTPGSCLPPLMLWWRTRRAPSTGDSFHTGASRSALGRFLGR